MSQDLLLQPGLTVPITAAASSKKMDIQSYFAPQNFHECCWSKSLLRKLRLITERFRIVFTGNVERHDQFVYQVFSLHLSFKVDRLQIIVVANKYIYVSRVFISRMPKLRAIPQLVSAPLNPIPIAEHFRRSHPLVKISNFMSGSFKSQKILAPFLSSLLCFLLWKTFT